MVITDTPIVDHIIRLASSGDTAAPPMSIVAGIIGMDDAEWAGQLAADGFSDADIVLLEDLAAAWIDRADLSRLSTLLSDVHDLDSEAELAPIFQEWPSDDSWCWIIQQVLDAGFPDPITACCYAAGEAMRAAAGVVAMASMRRQAALEPEIDWTIDPSDVAMGKAIADEGLGEDAKLWPTY